MHAEPPLCARAGTRRSAVSGPDQGNRHGTHAQEFHHGLRPWTVGPRGGDDRFVDADRGTVYLLETAKAWLARDFPGYRVSDVDSFLGGVLAELRGGAPLSPAAVRAVTFPLTKWRTGYAPRDVDRLVGELAQLSRDPARTWMFRWPSASWSTGSGTPGSARAAGRLRRGRSRRVPRPDHAQSHPGRARDDAATGGGGPVHRGEATPCIRHGGRGRPARLGRACALRPRLVTAVTRRPARPSREPGVSQTPAAQNG